MGFIASWRPTGACIRSLRAAPTYVYAAEVQEDPDGEVHEVPDPASHAESEWKSNRPARMMQNSGILAMVLQWQRLYPPWEEEGDHENKVNLTSSQTRRP